jgi:membrane protein required for colicin V production
MIWVDFVIIGILALSAVIGLARGLIREVLSLAIWVVAVFAAWTFHRPLADQLTPWLSTPSVRIGVAFIVLVLVVLILGAILGQLLTTLVDKTGLTGTDRLLGVVFGAARGALLVALLVYLAALTPIPEDPWWAQSRLIGHFQTLADRLLAMIPPELAAKLKSL